MIPRFTETAPWETGFSGIYEAEIAPALGKIEAERQALRRTRDRRLVVVGEIAVAAVAGILFLIPPGGPKVIPLVATLFLTVFGVLAVRVLGQSAYAERLRAVIVPHAAAFYGLSYDRKAEGAPPIVRYSRLGLIPPGEVELSDGIVGRRQGVDFALAEARVRRKRGKSTSLVFRGLLLRIATESPAPTPIVIAPERGGVMQEIASALGLGSGKELRHVDTGIRGFEALFSLRAGDPDAARAWLPASFLHALLALAEEETARAGEPAVAAAFDHDGFWMTIRRREPFLEPGALGESVSELEPHLHALLADLSLPRRLVDRLVGAEAAAA